MGGRAGSGAGKGISGTGTDRFGNGPIGQKLQKLGAAATKAFYTKGVADYFDGSNSASATKAYANYQNKLSDFKSAYKSATGGNGPALDDWQGLAAGFASGEYALNK